MSSLEIKPPKVPFLTLVETRYIVAGTVLTDPKMRVKATVLANGTIQHGEQVGSIHKVGAMVQGSPSCNGWDFWHIDGKPISGIRTKYLREHSSEV